MRVIARLRLSTWVMLMLVTGSTSRAAERNPLATVRAYADAMIEHGRDHYGRESSPLFAVTLNRQTLGLFEGEDLERITTLSRESWGIRPHDRTLTGANPMHDQNLYQVLYALSELTGEKRYAAEADRALRWFFEHCQSDATGLMYWGEHAGWDFIRDAPIERMHADLHEYFRPWVLWDRTFALAPDAARRFALGVWEHQIADHKTGDFSRHAHISHHQPDRHSQYPRHAGFYIATWAAAYQRTNDPRFLHAIGVLLDFYERHRNAKSGAILAEVDNPRSKNKLIWPQSNLSLAIDLWGSAEAVPRELGERMRAAARQIDRVYLKVPHDLGPDGAGFVTQGDAESLEPAAEQRVGARVHTERWATGYGEQTDAQSANLCLLRHAQAPEAGYDKLAIAAANRYLNTEPDIAFPVYPGTVGQVIWLLLDAYRLTGDGRYLDRAGHFADVALDMFFADGSPLPKASSQHDQYEAITGADTLMMAVLRLHVVRHAPDAKITLIWNDR